MDNETVETVVTEVTRKQPDKVKQLKNMFDAYQIKMILLSNQYSKNEVDKDEVVKQVQDFLTNIKTQFVNNWCMVEKTLQIINHLEKHIVEIGGDLNEVRTS